MEFLSDDRTKIRLFDATGETWRSIAENEDEDVARKRTIEASVATKLRYVAQKVSDICDRAVKLSRYRVSAAKGRNFSATTDGKENSSPRWFRFAIPQTSADVPGRIGKQGGSLGTMALGRRIVISANNGK